ncbi:MAG: hypothetical protein AAGI09_11765 [Pseudomonadota bacterium]
MSVFALKFVRLLAVFGCLGLVTVAPPARADLLGILGFGNGGSLDGLMTRQLDRFFDDFNLTADRLIASGASEGNLLMVQAGNQMRMTSLTAAHALGGEMDDAIGQLSAEAQRLVGMMQVMQRRVEAGLDEGVALADMLVISLERILDEANPFAANSLYVHRVEGLVVPPESTALGHKLVLRGPDFGSPSQDTRLEFDIFVDGSRLDVVPVTRDVRTDVAFVIPESLLDRYRTETELKVVPVTVRITRTTERWWPRRDLVDVTPDVRVEMAVLPKVIGTLKAVVTEPDYGWVPHTQVDFDATRERREAFDFVGTVPNPSTGARPRPGEQRWVRESVSATCDAVFAAHRRLPNGRYLPLSHSWFSDGWSFSAVCGVRSKQFGIDVGSAGAAGKLRSQTGIPENEGFNLLRRGARERRDTRCFIPAEEMRARAPVRSGCNHQSTRPIVFSPFGDSFTIPITGSVPAPLWARWTATAEAEIYAELETEQVVETEPAVVRHGESVSVDYEFETVTGHAVEFVFESPLVPDVTFPASRPPAGFSTPDIQNIGADKRRVSLEYRLNY